MTIEDLVALQEEGASARVLGKSASDNPYLAGKGGKDLSTDDSEELDACYKAWNFGWSLEDACHAGALSFKLRD